MSSGETSAGPFDLDRIEAIAAKLDLRQPNKEALESIVFEIGQYFEIDREPPPFEAVVDIATGVGKTYVLAATIEYLAGDGVRNFAVITPGRTILDKTVANFTPGHTRSLLGGMDVEPVIITSENFATPAMRVAMDDSDEVKLFIFTVQALTKPQTKVGRRTHKFQEGLGAAFYAHLQGLDDLVVFADEHHTYYGPAFSEAIRDLQPKVLLGLTATPHKKTPPDQIIYRYPLAAAIAGQLVKTPVLVGRKDDRTDLETKLRDGLRLVELKARMVARWCEETGSEPINPVMLVIAPKIGEADEIEGILTDPGFEDGRYADRVLTVHSDAPDEALAALEQLEEQSSPYRVVISVGMLKEGWDVKNVYVIASMRASVSEMLTEQTLGRGLRLPFGTYTGIEILDTLEVLGHERYQDLLKKAGVLNEQFIDRRTRAVLRRNAEGQLVASTETTEVALRVVDVEDEPGGAAAAITDGGLQGTAITSVEEHTARAEEQLEAFQVELAPRPDAPVIVIPRLKMTPIRSDFSLADITDLSRFQRLGERIAADPVGQLRRVRLGARIIEGADGLRRTELVTTKAIDRVESPVSLLPFEEARSQLIDRVLNAPVAPARSNQRAAAAPIIDAFMKGLGDQAEKILSGYMDRAAAGLIQLINEEQRKFAAKPSYGEVVELVPLNPTRVGRPVTTQDRFSAFKRGVGYEGYQRSMFAQDWFDSSPEREVANLLDDAEEILVWVRLQTGDLPILWTEGGREYNPDFIAVDVDGVLWLIEVKMDKEMTSADVQGKRAAAQRWANHVSADEQVNRSWNYLLVSETDVRTAHGSWEALKRLGS
jgi:type III restriction enzyme